MWPLPVVVPAAGALGGLWWLWRRAPWRGARPRHPVLLAHGVMGFTELGLGKMRQSYFKGIPERLEKRGITVFRPGVPAIASVERRAAALATFVRELDVKRVNIIAHSMGGLDARFAITELGLASRVASLTTIGTPHRGTPIADVGTLVGDVLGLGKLLAFVGIGVDAFYDLTTARMLEFNEQVKDAPGVRYFSVVSTVEKGDPDTLPLLAPSARMLSGKNGGSDGMVPALSQSWGEVLERVRADHWAEIGWSKHYDAPALYERVCRKLRARGL
jgi:triacylglycerol lipase